MSLFKRRTLLLGLTALGACGFEPVYRKGGTSDGLRGAILVDTPTTRNGFTLTARLEQRLGRAQSPRYGLAVTLEIDEKGLAVSGSNNIMRFNLLGKAQFTLRDLATGTPVLSETVTTFTSYSATQQPVATLAAERDANQRLIVTLSDKIVSRLLSRSDLV